MADDPGPFPGDKTQLDLLTAVARMRQLRDETTVAGDHFLAYRLLTCDLPRLEALLTPEVVAWMKASEETWRDFPESPPRPRVVCLCGSTRFYDMFRAANLEHTLAGEIVLSIGCDFRSDSDLAAVGALGKDPERLKRDLDELHKRKIDLADFVLVLNVGGYIGESTRGEIEYARRIGREVRFLEAPGD